MLEQQRLIRGVLLEGVNKLLRLFSKQDSIYDLLAHSPFHARKESIIDYEQAVKHGLY